MKRSLVSLLILFAVLTVAAATPPEPARKFSLPGKPGADNTYSVTAVPGSYYLRLHASAPQEGPQRDAEIRIDQSVPMKRRVIYPRNKEGSFEVERMALGTKPVMIRITVPPDVTIHRLEFRPVQKKLPDAAKNYRPPIVPRPDRPRLFINREMLPEVQARCRKGDGAEAWKTIQSIAGKPYNFAPQPDQEVGWDGNLVDALRCKAFSYLLTGDRKAGREAAELALKYFRVVNFGNGQDICRRTGAAIQAASMVYDWCYPLMTDAERRELISRFLWQAESMEIGWPPFLQNINTHHGNEAQLNKDLLAMAIAVYNEDPVPWQYCAYRLLEEARPMKSYLYKSGFHYEGIAYSNVRYNADITAALLLRRACGWTQYEPYTGKIPYAWFHFRTPDGQFLSMGDDYMLNSDYPGNPETYLIANALWPDAKLKDEYLRLLRHRSRNFYDPVLFLLTMDPQQKTDARRDDLPKAIYYGEQVSLMAARTGWDMGIASNDTAVSMTGAGLYHWSHQHLDAGNFQLYYRGLLTSDIGLYRDFTKAYTWNFERTSIAHSVMRFVSPDQKHKMYRITVTAGTQEGPNQGPEHIEDILEHSDRYSRGKVLAVSENPQAPYLQLELAKSYPGRVKKYIRTMVFLAAENPALLVYDEFETARPGVTPVWQITTLDTPKKTVSGELTAEHSFYGLPARLTVRTLLPKDPSVNILTGKAAHIVDGVYFAPTYPNRPEAHGSRTEITAPGASRFLHVLQPTPGTAAAHVTCREKGDVLEVASEDGWTVLLAPGKPPKATVTKPFKPLPPPRNTVYLDGKIIGKTANGRILSVTLPGIADMPEAEAAVKLNAKMIRDPETGSVFFMSRPAPARFSTVTAGNGKSGSFRDILEGDTAEFIGRGKIVCTAELKKPETWRSVSVRYPHGADRRANLRIELSGDGKTFQTVMAGQSSGKTRDFEEFRFPAQTVRAVRFTFNGNSQNNMTTVTGIRFNNENTQVRP